MNWRFWLGRVLMVLATLVLVLALFYLAWFGGAFTDYGLFGTSFSANQQLAAQLELMASVVLLVMAGCLFRNNIRWVVWTVMIVSIIGLAAFAWADGWSDDAYAALPAYLVFGFGYWLSRKGR